MAVFLGAPAASAVHWLAVAPAEQQQVLHVHCFALQADAFRTEHASRRSLERQMDKLCQSVQRRVAQAEAQQQEHEQLAKSHQGTLRDLEEAQGQLRLLQAQVRGPNTAGSV